MLRAALSLLAVAGLVLVNAESEDDVLVVGSHNYKDVIKNSYVLMEFCKHGFICILQLLLQGGD